MLEFSLFSCGTVEIGVLVVEVGEEEVGSNETSQGECKLMSKLDYESTSELSLWFVCALWRLACRLAGVPAGLARLSDSRVLCGLPGSVCTDLRSLG